MDFPLAYNAAWRVKQKLMQAMKERDDEIPLGDYVQIDVIGAEYGEVLVQSGKQ